MTAGVLIRQAFALLLGAVAGYAAYRAGLPLPWMLGPMILNTIASVAGAPVAAPVRLRPVVIPVIGVMLGSAITADVFANIGDWAVTLAVMVPFLACAAAASLIVYRKIGRLDPVTAYFAAMPGGINEMLLLGTEAGGNERRIAMAHATRILVVISCVGLFYGLVLGVRPGGDGGRPWLPLSALSLSDWGILAACALIGIPLAKLLRLPAGNVLGPMILSGIAHVTHLVDIPPPTLVVNGAQIVLGTIIGCRFVGATTREIGRDMGAGPVVFAGDAGGCGVFRDCGVMADGNTSHTGFSGLFTGGADGNVAAGARVATGRSLCVGHAHPADIAGYCGGPAGVPAPALTRSHGHCNRATSETSHRQTRTSQAARNPVSTNMPRRLAS